MTKLIQGIVSSDKNSIQEFGNLPKKERLKILISIAIKGDLEKVPKDLLKEENILPERENQTNLLHIAIGEDQLHCLPKEILTIPNLLLKDEMLKSTYEMAADMGKFDDIPLDSVSRDVLKIRAQKESILHKLAKTGQLNARIRDIVTEEMVFAKDQYNTTVLEYAIRTDALEFIPTDCLNGKNLLRNLNGDTVLHLIAKEGDFQRIEKKELTVENLLKRGKDGITVLMHAIKSGNYKNLPKNSITEKGLLEKNHLGQDIFEILFNLAIESNLNKQTSAYIKETIKDLLQTLSEKNIENINKKSLDYRYYINKHCNITEVITKELNKRKGIRKTKEFLKEEESRTI